jgi:ElaB/YqjD/DUF883 family membrane-anchored ribosome-binding protein
MDPWSIFVGIAGAVGAIAVLVFLRSSTDRESAAAERSPDRRGELALEERLAAVESELASLPNYRLEMNKLVDTAEELLDQAEKKRRRAQSAANRAEALSPERAPDEPQVESMDRATQLRVVRARLMGRA